MTNTVRKSLILLSIFLAPTVCSGLAVLFYPSLHEIYFKIILSHTGIAMFGSTAITLMLPWYVRKYGWLAKLISVAAIILLIASVLGMGSIVYFFPYCLMIWLLAARFLRDRSLRPLGATLFFYQVSVYCGVICNTNKQARFSGTTHGLWAILALAGFFWLLLDKLEWLHRGRLRRRAGIAISAVTIAMLLLAWGVKNFKPMEEEYFYTQQSGQMGTNGELPQPQALLQSAVCGTTDCHPTEYKQWTSSAHRFASNNRLFRRVVELAQEDGGQEGIRDCVNCHDPVATLSTAGLESWPDLEPGANQGVNCQVCHLIRGGDFEKGNGYLKLARELKYPHQDARPGTPEFIKFKEEIRLDPRPHINNFLPRRMLNQSKFCLPCHLVTVVRPVAASNPLRLHLLFSQWEKSTWKNQLSCMECHLPIFQILPLKYYVMDHRFLGVSTVHGQLARQLDKEDPPRLAEHISYTKAYLAGTLDSDGQILSAEPTQELPRKDFPVRALPIQVFLLRGAGQKRIKDYLNGGPILQVKLASQPAPVAPGGALTIQVTTVNARVGHDVPSGPIDMVRCWCEVTCLDQAGRILFKTGGLDENGDVREGTIYLGSQALLDATGRQIFDHRFWRAAKVVGKQVLPALASRVDEVKIPLPRDVEGVVSVAAEWRYLRINQRLWNMAFDGQGPAQVPLDVGGAQIKVPIVARRATP